MPADASPLLYAAQIGLIVGGLAALWRWALRPEARRSAAALAPWDITVTDFFLFLWLVLCSGLLVPFAAGAWFKHAGLDTTMKLILGTAAFQLGLLGGVLLFRYGFRRHAGAAVTAATPPAGPNPVLAGGVTFLMAVPLVFVVSLAWQVLLDLAHIPAPPQEAIDVLRHAKAGLPVTLLLVCALGLAPLTEELIFRAGIFRYARTRLPRWAALLGPSCIFGAMHVNLASFAPLVALGVLFSLAYERTGRITTTIVAHALFNLTATLFVLGGVNL